MRFNKGSTYPAGECGNFCAGIDDAEGADGGRPWGSRIECYGRTAEAAEELRDLVLASLTKALPRDVLMAIAQDVFSACEKEEGTIYGVDLGAIVDRYASSALPTDVLETERLTFDRASRDPGTVAVVYQDGRHVPVQLTLGSEGVECAGYASQVQPEPVAQPAEVTTNSDLRDRFAGLAMQGIVSSPNCPMATNDAEIARQAYALADAMLAKR